MKKFREYVTELFDKPLPFKVVLDNNDGDVNEDGVAYKFKSKKDNYLVTYSVSYTHLTLPTSDLV